MIANDRRKKNRAKASTLTALSLSFVLAGSIAQSATSQEARATNQEMRSATAAAIQPARASADSAMLPLSNFERTLASRIDAIGQSFNGDIGIAVKDIQSGYTTSYDGSTFFPQQSVSKFWVALTALDRFDRGMLNLEAPATMQRGDLTLFHQPIAQSVGSDGYTAPLSEFLYRALTQSDNSCNDFVLWKAGGPGAVRDFLAKKGIKGIRFGPGDRIMQSHVAGMEWKQSYAYGNAFYAARDAVPLSVRRTAFNNYIQDPVDGATPLGIVDALAKLKKGELLSPRSTERLLSIMSNTKTGPQRLKGGLAPGWQLSHKTGTGQILGGVQAGYNDIGVITSPDGRSYAIAVMIRKTAAPLGERMQAMQNVVRTVIDYASNAPVERYASKPGITVASSRTASIAATVAALSEESESN